MRIIWVFLYEPLMVYTRSCTIDTILHFNYLNGLTSYYWIVISILRYSFIFVCRHVLRFCSGASDLLVEFFHVSLAGGHRLHSSTWIRHDIIYMNFSQVL